MTPEAAQQWVDAYGHAWRSKDAARAAALFSSAGVYRSHPFRPPHVGRDAIRAYWERATARQRDLNLRFGRPIVDGPHVAVEWWAEGAEDDGDFTLPGCLVLRFDDDGLCEELREYWHLESSRLDPPQSWGS
jgi:nuclear transport factor 2 (NTF2) superfamily protein